MNETYILEVNNLNKVYSDFSLSDVSFSLPYGTVMGVIGENGAGKTTLMKSIINMIQRDSGSVEIFGTKITTEKDIATLGEIGVVFDYPYFSDYMTAYQISKIMKGIYRDKRNNTMFETFWERFNIT